MSVPFISTDYSPVFLPGLTMTSTALTDITAGDPVEVAGSGLVQKCTLGPSGLGSAKYVGVAAMSALAGHQLTLVIDSVVHEGGADGPVTAGDQVMASAKPGCQVKTVPLTAPTPAQADVDAARAVIGIALMSAADGGTIRWMQRR